ncbi:MAG: hypothetical protein OIF51_11465 [Cellvibrionaceae bacterium]|nr:hypothetical protein [Cellvibrionaceae bacterium]
MNKVHAYTSITKNYLPKARVLAQSLKKHNPDVSFDLVLSDDLPEGFDLAQEPFDNVIFAEDLAVDNFKAWVFSHRVVELCTAVKGEALEHIFENYGAEKVFYFDPDMALFDTMEELCAELDNNDILLTPHQTEPEQTTDAIMDNEMCSLKYGVFNLGFVGVANRGEGRRFSKWWRDRLIEFCRDDRPNGLFTDQKWVNLAPCFFENIKVLRKPIFNVATWNISTREVSGSLAEGVKINDLPLCFYHFSGFDSGAQEGMLNKYAKDNKTLWELRDWYIAECEKNGQSQLGKQPSKYAFFDSGEEIQDAQRLVYRNSPDLQYTYPDPFSDKDRYGKDNAYGKQSGPQFESTTTEFGTVVVDSGAGFRTVVSDMSHYFDHVAYNHRAAGGLKRPMLKGFAFLLRSVAKLVP